MAAIIAGFEVDFACLLQVVMHEKAFKVNYLPFPVHDIFFMQVRRCACMAH